MEKLSTTKYKLEIEAIKDITYPRSTASTLICQETYLC